MRVYTVKVELPGQDCYAVWADVALKWRGSAGYAHSRRTLKPDTRKRAQEKFFERDVGNAVVQRRLYTADGQPHLFSVSGLALYLSRLLRPLWVCQCG